MDDSVDSRRNELVNLLRHAAERSVDEHDFWEVIDRTLESIPSEVGDVVYDEATHYWGNYHSRNIFLFRTKPDPGQLSYGERVFALLADAIEQGWEASKIENILKRMR